jgi:hypothetical protein
MESPWDSPELQIREGSELYLAIRSKLELQKLVTCSKENTYFLGFLSKRRF